MLRVLDRVQCTALPMVHHCTFVKGQVGKWSASCTLPMLDVPGKCSWTPVLHAQELQPCMLQPARSAWPSQQPVRDHLVPDAGVACQLGPAVEAVMVHSSWHPDKPWAQPSSTAGLDSMTGRAPTGILPHLDAQLLTQRPQPINVSLIPLIPAAPNQLQL